MRRRRPYRGAGLVEAVAVMAVAAIILAGLIELAERAARRTLIQSEARTVSAGADGALFLAESGVPGAIADAAAAGGAALISRARLLNAGALREAFGERTLSGRTVEFAHHAIDANTLLAAAWALGGPVAGGGVLPAAGIELTGRLGGADPSCPAGFVCGPGFQRDVSAMIVQLGAAAPDPGSMMAIRFASLLQVNDLLLRTGEMPSRPELNRMDAGLEVTGVLANAGSVQAAATGLRLTGEARVVGAFTAGTVLDAQRHELRDELDAAGNLLVTGPMEGLGPVRSGGATFAVVDAPEARLLVLLGADFGSVIEVGQPAQRSGGLIAQESGLLSAGNLGASSARTPWMDVGDAELGPAGTANGTRAFFGELRSHASVSASTVSGGFRSEGTVHVDNCPNCGTAP